MRTGFLVSYLSGLLMFKGGEGQQWWRVVMGLPALFIAVQGLLLSRYFRHDSPKGYLLRQDKDHVCSSPTIKIGSAPRC